jgi:hypothetical protein
MHRFQGHFFDLTNITSGTSNFDLTVCNFSNSKINQEQFLSFKNGD